MNSAVRSLVTGFAAAMGLWPAGAAAETRAVPPASPALTIDNVRDAYASAGFQVTRAQTWVWTAPPVTSLHIHDQSSGRVLMVLVYADPAVAETARLQAQLKDVNGAHSPNPHLVSGYGASVWNRNVALVQTTQAELERVFHLQSDCANDLYVAPDLAPERNDVVDADFLRALTSGTLNL